MASPAHKPYGRLDRPFEMSVEVHPQASIVRLRGACTMEVADQLRQRLLDLAVEESPVVAIDMSDLDFIESTGIGGIVAGHLRMKRRGGELRIIAPSNPILEVLELTQLTRVFRVFPTCAAALAAN